MYENNTHKWTFSIADIAAMRFGYGIDVIRKNPKNKQDLLRHIKAPERFPPSVKNRPKLADRVDKVTALKKIASDIKQKNPSNIRAYKQAQKMSRTYVTQQLLLDSHAKFNSAVESTTPFFERLVFFWADHFSVSAKNNGVSMVAHDYEMRAIRPYVDGYFYDMLRAVIGHPAMLRFLDNHISVGPNSTYITSRNRKNQPLNKMRGLNENLGRELLELHTLGVGGGYTQTDVTNTGSLLAGWTVNKNHQFIFRPEYAEPNAVPILGKSYGGKTPDITHMEQLLQDLAKHPKTAEYICTKLARHFISDTPPAHVVQNLSQVFLNTRGHLPSVYEALLNTDEAWDTFGQKTKRPFDHLVSGVKAVGLSMDAVQPQAGKTKNQVKRNTLTVGMLISLNQVLYHVPDPSGWSDMGRNWITPQGVTFRLLWASRIARASMRKGEFLNGKTYQKHLYQVVQCCMGDAPPVASKILVENAPSKVSAVALALMNPAFLRR